MNSPRRAIHKAVRFYFTEVAWRRYGHKTVDVCQRYRVLRIKENSVEVIYLDEY
jgi:hypothetical protein